MWIVTLDAVQAKARLCAPRKVLIAVCGDGGNRRCAGAIVASETKCIVLGGGIEVGSARTGMRLVASGANDSDVCIAAVWATLG